MCDFAADSLRCSRCGYLAKRLPTYRVCRTVPELARKIATDQATKRISVPPMRIGTAISGALSAVGITPDRIKNITGKDCGCAQRKDTLDSLGAAFSATLERGLNTVANAVAPVIVEADDVAAIANSIQASDLTNPGLKDGPPSPPPASPPQDQASS